MSADQRRFLRKFVVLGVAFFGAVSLAPRSSARTVCYPGQPCTWPPPPPPPPPPPRSFKQLSSRPACASLATPGSLEWALVYSPGGSYGLSLTQSSTGYVSGSGITVNSKCPYNSVVAGTAEGNGVFSLAQTVPGNLCGEVTSQVTLSGPGCASATGTYFSTNSFNTTSTGTVMMSDGQGVPVESETTPVPVEVDSADPTVEDFYQYLQPTNYNFEGRTITESFPSPGTDTCWFPGGPFPQPLVNRPTKSIYPYVDSSVSSVATGYWDEVGPSVEVVDAYRLADHSIPCSLTYQQVMSIDTLSGSQVYAVNTLQMIIGPTTVTDIRNHVPATLNYTSRIGYPVPKPPQCIPRVDPHCV